MPKTVAVMDPDEVSDIFCPACEWSALEEGEISEGRNFAYKFKRCEKCGWQSQVNRYRLVHTKDAVEYYPDATFIRPDIALSLKLSGKLQLGTDVSEPAVSALPGEHAAVARCFECGGQAKLRCRLRKDVAALIALWECERCGFQSNAGILLSPGFFAVYDGGKRILWKDKSFLLTRNQRIIIDVLYKAHIEGSRDVQVKELRKALRSPNSRLRDSFRSANHELWESLIVHSPGAPHGTLRLNF